MVSFKVIDVEGFFFWPWGKALMTILYLSKGYSRTCGKLNTGEAHGIPDTGVPHAICLFYIVLFTCLVFNFNFMVVLYSLCVNIILYYWVVYSMFYYILLGCVALDHEMCCSCSYH